MVCATATALVERLRRIVNEPDDTTYDADALGAYIERFPIPDDRGVPPWDYDTSVDPPTRVLKTLGWMPTFDVWACAAEIWTEKAAVVAADYSFQADGEGLNRNQVYEQYMKQARFCSSKSQPSTIEPAVFPKLDLQGADRSYVINLSAENSQDGYEDAEL